MPEFGYKSFNNVDAFESIFTLFMNKEEGCGSEIIMDLSRKRRKNKGILIRTTKMARRKYREKKFDESTCDYRVSENLSQICTAST